MFRFGQIADVRYIHDAVILVFKIKPLTHTIYSGIFLPQLTKGTTIMSDKKSNDSRRKLLKSIVAGSGTVVAGKSLPESWSKPVIDSVVLPAHAVTTDEETPAPLNYFGPVEVSERNSFQLCIQCVGNDCSAKALENDHYYYEATGSLGADMTLVIPNDCDSNTVILRVETVNGVATGQLDTVDFIIPLALCGISEDDNQCID